MNSIMRRASSVLGMRPFEAALAAASWMVYTAYQVWIVWVGPIGYWNDTKSYVAVSKAPFPSATLLAGQRPPLVPILWKVTGTPLSFALVQTVIGVLAWTTLATTIGTLARPGWRRLLAFASVLGFASCWQVTEWNWNLLSESLALSATAVVCASCIWLVRRFSWLRAVTLVAACALFAADRDQAIWVIIPAGLCLCVFALVRYLRALAGDGARARGIMLLGLGLVAVAGLAEVGASSSHRNVINMEDVFYVRVFPFPNRVHWFAAHGMPEWRQIDVDAASTRPTPGEAKVVGIDLGSAQFRPLEKWFSDSAETAYIQFLATHPAYDLEAPFDRPALTYNNADGNLAFYGSLVDPDPRTATNHALPLLPDLMFPAWEVVHVVACLSGVVVFIRRLYRRPEVKALLLLLATGLFSMLVAWHGDGMEVARHTVEGNVQSRLAVMGLGVLGVLGARVRPARRRARLPRWR
jgi:hypothetical protein